MLVDTGSSVTLLHERVWNDIAGGKKLNASQCPVMGESLSLCGQRLTLWWADMLEAILSL